MADMIVNGGGGDDLSGVLTGILAFFCSSYCHCCYSSDLVVSPTDVSPDFIFSSYLCISFLISLMAPDDFRSSTELSFTAFLLSTESLSIPLVNQKTS